MSSMTPDHYLNYAEKKRKKLLIIFGALSVIPLYMLASFYYKHGLIVSSNEYFNMVVWLVTIVILSAITFYLHQLKTDSWYKFLGLKEMNNLIALEENITGDTLSYNGKHYHRDCLKKGWYKGYSWF